MEYDLVIVGAGPVGLSFARSLAGGGLTVVIVDPQSTEALANPAFDGREIALTQHSARLMQQLGLWQRLRPDDIHELRDALVLNGDALPGMKLEHREGTRAQLGYLVANHLIRRAAWEAVQHQPDLTMMCGLRVTAVDPGVERSRVSLSDGRELRARLVVAADSRFSETRRAVGIASDMHDFGKTMLVCRMQHAEAHEQVAWEWFRHGQTLALLPLTERLASVVITLPAADIQILMTQSEAYFNANVSARFLGRLGAMQLVGTRHAYPLVGVYPERFVAQRFALIGDAAVGMHPVTAHGYNLGLLGQDLLATAIRTARRTAGDIADPQLLSQFERELRRASRPLYLATRAIVGLYTDERLPARALRRAGVSVGARLRPFRRALIRGLTQDGDSRAATFPLLGALKSLSPLRKQPH